MHFSKALQSTLCQVPLLTGQFYFKGKITFLSLYEDHFVYLNRNEYISINFNEDTKFDILSNKSEHKLIFETLQIHEFYPRSSSWQSDCELWEQKLIKLIKRKRFHDLFKGIKKIGKGNFASVYLSQKQSNKKYYAVKAFQKAATYKSEKGKEGLDNEIKIQRKLDQKNIPKLQGVYESQNSVYVVQEFIHGKNLGEILEQQKFIPFQQRKKLIKDILSGVAEMAEKNILHRDIKPENIMVENGGLAKIVDFGLATDIREPQYLFVRCGTPGYVAPEIINIRDCEDAQLQTISDMFSVGAVFYQIIFGKNLFEGESNSQVLLKNRKCLISIPAKSADGDEQQLALLRKMLAVNPDSRITARQALNSSYFKKKDARCPLKEIKNLQGFRQVFQQKVKKNSHCQN